MKKMVMFTMTGLMGLTLMLVTVFTTNRAEQNRKDFFENKSAGKMYFLGNNTNLSNSNDITQYDVQLMWQKVQLGIQVVDQFWETKFAQNGKAYRAPQVRYYTSPVYTGCGKVDMNNAFYCSADHTIYFDAIFFTRLMKGVGNQLGTDGDMAIIFVIAHEWGHAVQGLTGRLSSTSILNETNADCTAGAFTLYAHQQGILERGDIEEAVTAISNFGDDLPWTEPGAHGNSEERLMMFKRGLQKGIVGCGGGFNR